MDNEDLKAVEIENGHEKEVDWIKQIEAYKKSGLSIKKYCKKANLKYSQLSYRLKKHAKQKKCLTQLSLTSNALEFESGTCRVELQNGVRITFNDPKGLTEVLDKLLN